VEPRARASLVILASSLSGAELAERLGVRGDRQWDQGSPTRDGSPIAQKWSGWEMHSRQSREAPAIKHLRDVMARSSNLAATIRDLTREHAVERVSFWLHLDSPTSGLSLEPELLTQIAAIGSLEIDIYS